MYSSFSALANPVLDISLSSSLRCFPVWCRSYSLFANNLSYIIGPPSLESTLLFAYLGRQLTALVAHHVLRLIIYVILILRLIPSITFSIILWFTLTCSAQFCVNVIVSRPQLIKTQLSYTFLFMFIAISLFFIICCKLLKAAHSVLLLISSDGFSFSSLIVCRRYT